jgi:pSer/pThr/pTyr-binding forkhead associated (FHA) protein
VSRLVIYEGEEQRAEHELARAVVGLGRHPQNDIVLDDRTLSRFHARIERRDDRYVVIDLGAQNGVHLNGERIAGEALLQSGDRIDLGRYTAVFQAARANQKKVSAKEPARPVRPVAKPEPEPDLDLDLDLDLDVDLDAGLDDLDLADEPSQVDHVAPQPTLVLLFNGMEVSRHPVGADGLVIGRSKQCDVVISLLGLSRKHTRVSVTDEGIAVEDLGSQNGTWVNNERVDGLHVLQHGDILNYYDYSVLFLEDGEVEVGFPGAGFNPPGTSVDDLSSRETNQQGASAQVSASAGSRRPSTIRSPIADDIPPDDETALGRPRPGSRKRTDDGLNLDDLGDGSFLGDEFEEGASKPRPSNPLFDDDDDDLLPSSASPPAAASGMGTELIDQPSDLSRGAGDEDLEADIAFSAAASDFVNPTTAGDLKLGDRTSVGFEVSGLGGGWPSDDDLEQAMMVLEATSVTLEVTMRGKPYTQVPLSQPVMRLGSDPRCEISMPRSSGLRPWHVTLAQVGASILAVRSNRASVMEVDGREVDSALLRHGDTLTVGKVAIVVRARR